MKTTILLATAIIVSGFIFKDDMLKLFSGTDAVKKHAKKIKHTNSSPEVRIKGQWTLPPILREVSGIVYMGNERFACVQDELGTIFIYNKASGQIENEIVFTGPGDFEGIAIKGNTAYVVRADGLLFEVDMNSKATKEFRIASTTLQNIEGLCYDSKHDRLLLAGKDADPSLPGYKGIYSFSISKNNFVADPIFKIALDNAVLDNGRSKKGKSLTPSAIGIHPLTHDIFILDGPKAMLLTLDDNGNAKKFYELGKGFAKAEGITFTPQGEIYISNEGKKDPPNIIQVEIQ
jgi:uncharacterized protein YjiK